MWAQAGLDYLDELATRFQQWRCKHPDAIPALRDSEGWKICTDCGKQTRLSDAQFYAEFGTTINHVLAHRWPKRFTN